MYNIIKENLDKVYHKYWLNNSSGCLDNIWSEYHWICSFVNILVKEKHFQILLSVG